MSSWTSGGSWLSALTTTASEPEPESEQQPKTAIELVAQLTAEEEEARQADQDALLAASQGAGATSLHADVASALAERLQASSIPVKMKAVQVMVMLLTNDTSFAAAARPHLAGPLAEHTRFGESDPRDQAAELIRKAAVKCASLLPPADARPEERTSGTDEPFEAQVAAPGGRVGGEEDATTAEGVPPVSTGTAGNKEDSPAAARTRLTRASSEPDRGLVYRDEEAREHVKQLVLDLQAVTAEGGRLDTLERAAGAGSTIKRKELDDVLEKVDTLETDVESLETGQIQQTSAIETGQQQQQAQVRALQEQLQQLSAQMQEEAAEQKKQVVTAAEADAALAAAHKQAQEQQAERLSALEARMESMSSELSEARTEAETERARAAAAEQRFSALLEKHGEKLKERDDFEISTSEALANEVDDVKSECFAKVQAVADTTAMMKETVNMLMEQISESTAAASAAAAAPAAAAESEGGHSSAAVDALAAKITATEAAWGDKLAAVEQALAAAASTSQADVASKQSVEALSTRVEFLDQSVVQLMSAESLDDPFSGGGGGGGGGGMQQTVAAGAALGGGESGGGGNGGNGGVAAGDVSQLTEAQDAQGQRISAIQQQLSQHLADFVAFGQAEKAARDDNLKLCESLVEMKVETLKTTLQSAAVEQQETIDFRLKESQESVLATMADLKLLRTEFQELQDLKLQEGLQTLETGLVQAKDKRRQELKDEVERLSTEIEEKLAAEREQAVEREIKAAQSVEQAEERTAELSTAIAQLTAGQQEHGDQIMQAQADHAEDAGEVLALKEQLKALTEQQQSASKASDAGVSAVQAALTNLVESKVLAQNEHVESLFADQSENLKAERQEIFASIGAIGQKAETVDAVSTEVEGLKARLVETLARADGFDESMAEHHKALAESDQRVAVLTERVEAADGEAMKSKAEAAVETAAAVAALQVSMATVEKELAASMAGKDDAISAISAIKEDVAAWRSSALARQEAAEQQLGQASEAAANAAREQLEPRLGEVKALQEALQGKIDKQEQIVIALAGKTKGLEDLSSRKMAEMAEDFTNLAAKVDHTTAQAQQLTS
eukprot:COSAG06_NODE_2059_length_7689_cov_3.076539_4_plen_1081_part_00